MSTSVADRCPWCASPHAEPAWTGAEPHDFQVRRCTGCGVRYTTPVLDADGLAPYYRETYYGEQNRRFNPLMEWCIGWFRRRRARALTRLVKPGRVLDIGCGRGLTLAALRDLGWQTRGCELSETSSRYAREVLRLDVRCGGFSPDDYADREFDAVVLWHVLEHLTQPQQVLAACARILKPGGVLVLAVPNLDSYQARWTRYGWFHLDLPRHRTHFSAPWLREKLAAYGFHVVDEFHGSLEQNLYGWIQSGLNRIGLPRNLLYDLLRRRSARTIADPWRTHPWQSAASLFAAVLLLPPAAAATFVEWVMQRGATVEFYAVRSTRTMLDDCLPLAATPAVDGSGAVA